MPLRHARQIMRSDPAAVNEELKLLLGQVLVTKAYPVADLVIPVRSGRGMGGGMF